MQTNEPNEGERITLRPVVADDRGFLIEAYGSTRTEELALTGWDEAQRRAFIEMQFAAQQLHYQNNLPHFDQRIILSNNEPIGRLYVARLEDQIRILDITILPAYRGKGVGTQIIEELMSEAAGAGKPLRIYVESFNASLRLFERLGFTRIGEQGYSYLMEWRSSEV